MVIVEHQIDDYYDFISRKAAAVHFKLHIDNTTLYLEQRSAKGSFALII